MYNSYIMRRTQIYITEEQETGEDYVERTMNVKHFPMFKELKAPY